MWIAIAEDPDAGVRYYIPKNLPLKIFNLFRKEFGVTNWCPDVFAGFYSEILNECGWCECCPLKHYEDSECCDGLFEVYDDMDFNYVCYPDKDSREWVKKSALDLANYKWIWK